jgi:CxxC motif-containing protein (DUF1111 family)
MIGTILVCPACQKRLRATGRLPAGEMIRCPSCGAASTIDVRPVVSSRAAIGRSGPFRLLIGLTSLAMLGAWLAAGSAGVPRKRDSISERPPSKSTVAKVAPVPPVTAPEIPPRSAVEVVAGPAVREPDHPVQEAEGVRVAGAGMEIARGRELFVREWVPDDARSHGGDGLGPVYNESSCVACHNLGGVGGGGPNGKNVDILSARNRPRPQMAHGRRPAGRENEAAGQIHPGFVSAPSVVLHRYGIAPEYSFWRLERLAMSGAGPERGKLPENLQGAPGIMAKVEIELSRPSAGSGRGRMSFGARQGPSREVDVVRSQRNPTALFGAGVIDSIPDKVIEDQARQVHLRFPEIQGRVSRLADGRIGRFGWKAQLPSLQQFVLTACAVELGLEVPDHPQGGDPLLPDLDAPGPDLTAAECDALVAYVGSLPAPSLQVPAVGEGSSVIRAGRDLFRSIGCAICHTPNLGAAEGIYSDLLLHDMGSESSDSGSYGVFRPGPVSPGLTQPVPLADGPHPEREHAADTGATDREWRTPPLWGLRDSGPYLHDGRAETLEQAIALHGGQGQDTANRYFGLPPRRRQQVQAFLKSLVAPVATPSS